MTTDPRILSSRNLNAGSPSRVWMQDPTHPGQWMQGTPGYGGDIDFARAGTAGGLIVSSQGQLKGQFNRVDGNAYEPSAPTGIAPATVSPNAGAEEPAKVAPATAKSNETNEEAAKTALPVEINGVPFLTLDENLKTAEDFSKVDPTKVWMKDPTTGKWWRGVGASSDGTSIYFGKPGTKSGTAFHPGVNKGPDRTNPYVASFRKTPYEASPPPLPKKTEAQVPTLADPEDLVLPATGS